MIYHTLYDLHIHNQQIKFNTKHSNRNTKSVIKIILTVLMKKTNNTILLLLLNIMLILCILKCNDKSIPKNKYWYVYHLTICVGYVLYHYIRILFRFFNWFSIIMKLAKKNVNPVQSDEDLYPNEIVHLKFI